MSSWSAARRTGALVLGGLLGALLIVGAADLDRWRYSVCGACGRPAPCGPFTRPGDAPPAIAALPHEHIYLRHRYRLEVIRLAAYQGALLRLGEGAGRVMDLLAAMDDQEFHEATSAVRFAARSSTPVDLVWDEGEGSFEMAPP
ncbi:MAG: hypothetical protein HY722_14095 [Planctomycetes bacterium]|nr:hypothetical protein [Planctomycetota bacterium]